MSKKIIIIAATILALMAAFYYYFTKSNIEPSKQAIETKKVFISKITDHPALDTTVDGIVNELEAKGYVQGKNLDLVIESAQANPALSQQIAANL